MPVINAKNISMSYEGKKVIESVSFCVEKGDFICILGENGSGKTTLLKALTGLKKIDSGTLEFDSDLKKNQIGYLPQQTDVQRDFPASAWEVVLSGTVASMGFAPFYTKKQKQMAKSAMEKLEILHLSKKCYHELSGGQQQKVLLARAICASKKLLILDEPTTGLDEGASREFYAFLQEMKNQDITIIMISHDVKNALGCANKVLHLESAGGFFFGSCADYAKNYMVTKED